MDSFNVITLQDNIMTVNTSKKVQSLHLHPFARVKFRNNGRIFGIKCGEDRRRHMYIIGKTGTGKTTLLKNLIQSDLQCGHGLAVIDPHGDLSEFALKVIPKRRKNHLILIDPSNTEHPIPMNILEKVSPEKRPLVASSIIGIFKKIFPDFWGPRLEHVLRNSLLALLELPQSTLMDLPRLLLEERFREKVVTKVTDPIVKYFFEQEYSTYTKSFLPEVLAPVLNKVGAFLSQPVLRNSLGQVRSRVDFRKVMDEEKILIADLSKGKIGEEASSLFGAVLITKFELAALSRVNIPEDQRKDFFLYVDEFPSFITRSFVSILAEARKYRLCLILAHQYLDQLDPELQSAILGNVGTIICFRLGAKDAEVFEKEFEPVFKAIDFIELPTFHIYLKLMIDGRVSRGFSGECLKGTLKD